MKTLEDIVDDCDTRSASSEGYGSVMSLKQSSASCSSRFSSSMPSSSMTTVSISCNLIKTTSSEIKDENVLQSMMVVNYL